MKNFKSGLIFGSLILAVVLVSVFVMAAGLFLDAPGDLNFYGNTTPEYDVDGTFFVNWSIVDDAWNYTIFIYADDEMYITATNDTDSLTNHTFTNTTDANYTFTIQAENGTAAAFFNSTNISMIVDMTAPTIEYNATGMNVDNANVGQSWVSINISGVYDLHNATGATVSYTIYNSTGAIWNQTNFTDAYDTTTINWTPLLEGVYYYNVTVNDSATNSNYTDTYTITLDTTVPVATLSCTPDPVAQHAVVTCTCSGTDTGGSGLNSALTTAATTPSAAATGTYTVTTCSVTDNAGNSATATDTYSVTGASSGNSGGGSYSTSFWTKGTHAVAKEQFALGFTKQLSVRQRIKVQVGSSNHHVGITELTATAATINISSDPQQAVLLIGDERKFEVSGDNYYDIFVKLNSIENNKADVTIKSINELISEESVTAETMKEEEAIAAEEPAVETIEEKSSSLLWWIFGGIVIIIILVLVFGGANKKVEKKKK